MDQDDVNQAQAQATMPWHLFRIDCSDDDGSYSFFVSAESESQLKAEELAEGSVLDDIGTEESPGTIDSTTFLGLTDSDIFEKTGPV